MGFRFHRSRKVQAAFQAFASAFVFAAIAFMISGEQIPVGEVWELHPAWFLAAAVFLLFTLALTVQLIHILRTKFVLEFASSAVIDRRRIRMRVIPYAAIEIFSPEPERLFHTDAAQAEFREEAGLTEFISVSARLLDSHPAAARGDFVFFEKVQMPTYDEQQDIIKRLRSKITRFDRLTEDDGDDADEFDKTNA